jgi:hypothetical protein
MVRAAPTEFAGPRALGHRRDRAAVVEWSGMNPLGIGPRLGALRVAHARIDFGQAQPTVPIYSRVGPVVERAKSLGTPFRPDVLV